MTRRAGRWSSVSARTIWVLRPLILSFAFFCSGPAGLPAQAAGPGSRISLGQTFGAMEHVVAPLLSCGMATDGSGSYCIDPAIPVNAKIKLLQWLSVDLGATFQPIFYGNAWGTGVELLFQSLAGLSWEPLGVFRTGPFLSASAYADWIQAWPAESLALYGLRTTIGFEFALGHRAGLSCGVSADLPWLRGEGGEGYSLLDCLLWDLRLGYSFTL